MINCDEVENPFEEKHMPALLLLMKGKNARQIAAELSRPYDTVVSQIKRLHNLAGVNKTSELIHLSSWNRWKCKYCKSDCEQSKLKANAKF